MGRWNQPYIAVSIGAFGGRRTMKRFFCTIIFVIPTLMLVAADRDHKKTQIEKNAESTPTIKSDQTKFDKLARRIEGLIKGLDDDDFKVRERSEAELIKIGNPALDAVLKAIASKSAEVKFRAERVLVTIPRLVAYYPFDDTPKDASGSGNDGVPKGRVEYVEGVVGKAVRFYGIDDIGYLRVPNSVRLQFSNTMSIACWYRIEAEAGQTGDNLSGEKVANAHQAIVAKHGDISGFSILSLSEHRPTRDLSFITGTRRDRTKRFKLTFSPEKPLRRWLHVAVVADQTGIKLYHNGQQIAGSTKQVEWESVNQRDLFIGIHGWASPQEFRWYPLNGAVDELRIFSYALSSEEIAAIYNKEKRNVISERKRDNKP